MRVRIGHSTVTRSPYGYWSMENRHGLGIGAWRTLPGVLWSFYRLGYGRANRRPPA